MLEMKLHGHELKTCQRFECWLKILSFFFFILVETKNEASFVVSSFFQREQQDTSFHINYLLFFVAQTNNDWICRNRRKSQHTNNGEWISNQIVIESSSQQVWISTSQRKRSSNEGKKDKFSTWWCLYVLYRAVVQRWWHAVNHGFAWSKIPSKCFHLFIMMCEMLEEIVENVGNTRIVRKISIRQSLFASLR